jgi:integration host factor subunit alpha
MATDAITSHYEKSVYTRRGNDAPARVDDAAQRATEEAQGRRSTVTRSDLAEAIFRRIGLSRLESAHLVEAVIEEVSDAILRGENVKLSSFGTFMQRSKRERVGRNPKTGVEATISPRKVLIFKASHIMRDRINNGQVNED